MDYICPRCGETLDIPDVEDGSELQCPTCQADFIIDGGVITQLSDFDSIPNQIQGAAISKKKPNKEYKVLTQKDKWFSGKFDPEMLESAINSYARQGWRVVSCATATFPGLIGVPREELVVILERG